MSDSVQPHRRQPTRLPRPWDSPGKNTGVGCHFLLQRMKMKSESEVAQSCPALCDPMDCSLPGSSVHGIFHRQEYWSGVPLPSSHVYLYIKMYLDGLCLGWWTSSGNIRDYDKSLHLGLFSFCKYGLSFLVYKFCTQFVQYTLFVWEETTDQEKIFLNHTYKRGLSPEYIKL